MSPTSHSFNNIDLGGVCFISDLHLSENMPATLAQFESFCQTIAVQYDTLIILGDLFEYWLGDDTADNNPAAKRVIKAIQNLRQQGKRIGFVAGNRDFLIRSEFATRAHFELLPDPCTIKINHKNVLISHGDIFCIDEPSYQRFRRLAHTTWVQNFFLKTPFHWRQSLAHRLRKRSHERWLQASDSQQNHLSTIQNVNQNYVKQILNQQNCHILIHGHTHRPSTHITYDSLRLVLPDWSCEEEAHFRWGYVSWPRSADIPELLFFTKP